MAVRKSINPNVDTNPKTTAKSGSVLVACKLEEGAQFQIPSKSGGVEVVILNGALAGLRNKPRGPIMPGGAGLTEIPAETWEYIKAHWASWRPLKNGLIFATDAAKAYDEIRERAEIKTGFEPLNKDRITKIEERR